MEKAISIDDFDKNWQYVGLLSAFDANEAKKHREIGLFKAVMRQNKVTVYIGMAREERNGGLGKRIRDFVRTTSSARSHPGGVRLNCGQNEVCIYILSIPRRKEILKLRQLFIQQYHPTWNKNRSKPQ